jgi:pyruvate dehydrogenase E1 component alpha subunit
MDTNTLTAADVDTRRRLYRELLRIRLVEEKIVELYPEQEMRCPVHLSIGQEAVPVGISAHLRRDDQVMSGHRSHAHYLAKGGNLRAMYAEFYGKATGCASGRGGSMHLVDLEAGFLGSVPIVGATIPIGVGAAWAGRMRGSDRVYVVYFGEGATEEGVFYEAINFASLKKLSVLFVCENNLYSVYSPMSVRQPEGVPVYEKAKAHGVPVRYGNGNDVMEVHRIAEESVKFVRGGNGPMFLEFETYRWREHCGPNFDNSLGYRTEAEFEIWRRQCPLDTFEAQLVGSGGIADKEIAAMRREIQSEIEDAVTFAKQSPYPDAGDAAKFTYAERVRG